MRWHEFGMWTVWRLLAAWPMPGCAQLPTYIYHTVVRVGCSSQTVDQIWIGVEKLNLQHESPQFDSSWPFRTTERSNSKGLWHAGHWHIGEFWSPTNHVHTQSIRWFSWNYFRNGDGNYSKCVMHTTINQFGFLKSDHCPIHCQYESILFMHQFASCWDWVIPSANANIHLRWVAIINRMCFRTLSD